jgi:hypothetical protein
MSRRRLFNWRPFGVARYEQHPGGGLLGRASQELYLELWLEVWDVSFSGCLTPPYHGLASK